ncbi:hypothetical protein [Paraburkholderia sp. BL6669N2]|uniref:hypothetical protein n=1 Tax=Paraburkholderia sp. BL6669N2 TaxID=1938807 RepID=UPI00216200A2|nr:hypothetical protein [Paraburkholderia sp. BL6669N2]
MPEISSTLAERFRKVRREAGGASSDSWLVRGKVLAERRNGEQFFAGAGIRRGWRGREWISRSIGAASAV